MNICKPFYFFNHGVLLATRLLKRGPKQVLIPYAGEMLESSRHRLTKFRRPVEESGNMILMTYAYYKFSGNVAYLQQHYAKMYQWAQYLLEYTLIPGQQLSTGEQAESLHERLHC